MEQYDVICFPKNINTIKNDYIYENIILKDDEGRIYKPPGYYINRYPLHYVPIFFKDLPVTYPLSQMDTTSRSFIPKINKSIRNLKCSHDNNDHYCIISKNNTIIDLNDTLLK